MSIWGIGAFYEVDVHTEFIRQNCVCIGWGRDAAPALYRMFDSIKVGDIVYIKSFARRNKQLHIKADGIVTDVNKRELGSLGTGITVKWKTDTKLEPLPITPERYRNNVYSNTIYEEFDKEIAEKLINALMQ